jgi:hypothetical protein
VVCVTAFHPKWRLFGSRNILFIRIMWSDVGCGSRREKEKEQDDAPKHDFAVGQKFSDSYES